MPGPEKTLFEKFAVRLPAGAGRRIDAVLLGGEIRSAFVRRAIENELHRRENERHDPRQDRGVHRQG